MKWQLFRCRTHSGRAKAEHRRWSRKTLFEPLERREVLTALPYGAMPDDTGEFMLGDVLVTVVLMESDPQMSPGDNGTVTINGQPKPYPPENWTSGLIAEVKSNITQGVNWWAETLDAMPNVRDGLLNFTFDFTYADNPVSTGYEPIARPSNDYALWVYDFLSEVGFDNTGNIASDIRAFNNYQRLQNGTDWAFTIFVVNDEADPDDRFDTSGSFGQAFAFSGGQFMVVPAHRPASTFAHETGHMFWAYDEYAGTVANYESRRGYYNTQNTNHVSNPAGNHANSIMSNGDYLTAAFLAHTSSTSSLETVGWKDTDGDGIFDVLDVPFDLYGTGEYDAETGFYTFTGTSKVRTLPNKNSSGLKNDITINRIRRAEYSIDGGEWLLAASYTAQVGGGAHETEVNLSFPVPTGNHEIRIRTVDTRTGVTSIEFVGTTSTPATQSIPSGAGGFLFRDDNNNGLWDQGEVPLIDWALELVDNAGNLIDLGDVVEPDAITGVVNIQGLTLTAFGGDVSNGTVYSQQSTHVPSIGNVLFVNSLVEGKRVDTWTSASRRLKIEFDTAQTVVNVTAVGSGAGSIGRLEAYNAAGELIGRYTTRDLGLGSSEMMSIARPQGDIKYVIAGSHVGTEVILDLVTYGPKAVVTTDINGAYVLPDLPAGSYNIRVVAPASFQSTTGSGEDASIQMVPGIPLANVNFGFRFLGSPWQNPSNSLDIDADGEITPLDALIIINRLNSNPTAQLPGTRPPNELFYFDVDADVNVTPLDALIVINYLNSSVSQSFATGESVAGKSSSFAAASSSFQAPIEEGTTTGEGEELLLAPPASAAEYYARNPFHVLNLPGDNEPCTCGHCVDQAIDSIVAPPPSSLGIGDLNGLATAIEKQLASELEEVSGDGSNAGSPDEIDELLALDLGEGGLLLDK